MSSNRDWIGQFMNINTDISVHFTCEFDNSPVMSKKKYLGTCPDTRENAILFLRLGKADQSKIDKLCLAGLL
jgi:hypothetical protein